MSHQLKRTGGEVELQDFRLKLDFIMIDALSQSHDVSDQVITWRGIVGRISSLLDQYDKPKKNCTTPKLLNYDKLSLQVELDALC